MAIHGDLIHGPTYGFWTHKVAHLRLSKTSLSEIHAVEGIRVHTPTARSKKHLNPQTPNFNVAKKRANIFQTKCRMCSTLKLGVRGQELIALPRQVWEPFVPSTVETYMCLRQSFLFLVLGFYSCPWVPVLSLGATSSLVLGYYSCPWVKV